MRILPHGITWSDVGAVFGGALIVLALALL